MEENATIDFPVCLERGDPVPRFKAAALGGNPSYAFDSAAGRHILMLFFGTVRNERCANALALIKQNRALLDDEKACFFGISIDPSDAKEGRIAQSLPGIRFFLDYDGSVSKLFGAATLEADGTISPKYQPFWLLLDYQLRVQERYDLAQGEQAFADLAALTSQRAEISWAPVLLLPRIFEPDVCSHLIKLYQNNGGQESGFMRQANGKTVAVVDHGHKRRSDYVINDRILRDSLVTRIQRRLVPEVQRVFQFHATRIERYIVACYDAETGGHFKPHRDNTTKGTAHRRFAVTINLNADEYEGGNLRFPEFGNDTYRAPTGGAIVFSCSLLHEATPVTQGHRYAFLPFLYDDAAAAIREENNKHLGDGVAPYRNS